MASAQSQRFVAAYYYCRALAVAEDMRFPAREPLLNVFDKCSKLVAKMRSPTGKDGEAASRFKLRW